MATARVHVDKLIQHVQLLPGDVLHVDSAVYLVVQIAGRPGRELVVEAAHTLDSEGNASTPRLGRLRAYAGPWNDAECAARIQDYIAALSPTRQDWFKGINGTLMSNWMQISRCTFEFAFHDGGCIY